MAAVRWSRTASSSSPTATGLTCYVPTQAPHGVRPGIARPRPRPDQVRVDRAGRRRRLRRQDRDVRRVRGRGEGRAVLGRPVKWTETRSENMVAMTQGAPRSSTSRWAWARRHDRRRAGEGLSQDGGAYPTIGAFLPFLTRTMSQGVYDDPQGRVQRLERGHQHHPTARLPRRGPARGHPMLERILDMAADELDIDPVEIRKQNFIPPEAFPLTTVTARTTTSVSTRRRSTRRAAIAGYDELRAEQARRRERGDAGSSASGCRPTSRSPRAGCSRSSARSRSTTTAP